MSLSEKAYSEKRDFIRMKISAPLTATLSADQEVLEGQCLDLSGGGMRVKIDRNIPLGTVLERKSLPATGTTQPLRQGSGLYDPHPLKTACMSWEWRSWKSFNKGLPYSED